MTKMSTLDEAAGNVSTKMQVEKEDAIEQVHG